MGFYTVLSLNRIDVNVRDIFASGELPHLPSSLPPPPPHPLLKVPNPTFKVVSWYCGVDGFNKKTHGTIPTPYHKNEPTMVSATPTFILCYATPNWLHLTSFSFLVLADTSSTLLEELYTFWLSKYSDATSANILKLNTLVSPFELLINAARGGRRCCVTTE